jgi:pyruvate carboxylase subunit B
VHTAESYIELADTLIKGGADEICLKDMAGIGRPAWLGKIVTGIKKLHPNTPLQYHSHAGPGFAMASILEVCRAGVEYVDVAMEPLSWGTGHVDVLAVQSMLKDAGFDVPEINMDAYMKVRSLTQSFIDDFLGYYIDNKNRYMNSLLIGPGLPGGMMGSLMADLSSNLESINKWKVKNNQPELTQDDLLVKLFNEVEYIWPMVGYPPLVTPYSQYVKNLALMNVMQMEKGKERWGMIADDIWDMLMGKGGNLPGELHPDIMKLAKQAGKELFTAHPQSVVEDALPKFRKEMEENGWDFGPDDEELFELAMHPQQYRAYKSGDAKKAFEEDLAKRKAEGAGLMVKAAPASAVPAAAQSGVLPTTMNVNVNGENFRVTVSYGDTSSEAPVAQSAPAAQSAPVAAPAVSGDVQEVQSPLEGKFYLTKNTSETPIKVGDVVKEGDLVGYVEAMKTFNAIRTDKAGKIVEILKATGEDVEEDDVLIRIQ